MAIHKLLINDFYDDEPFTLFGIHCNIEDYRLAYLLNKALKINLCRKPKDIDIDNSKVFYAIYEWTNTHKFITWNMVSNLCKIEQKQEQEDSLLLEFLPKTVKTFYLMPEFKKVNYFLKVDSALTAIGQKVIVQDMQSISQIIAAYTIQPQQIKSKHNLIFN